MLEVEDESKKEIDAKLTPFVYVHKIAKVDPEEEKLIRYTNSVYLPNKWRGHIYGGNIYSRLIPPTFEIQNANIPEKKAYVCLKKFTDREEVICPPWVISCVASDADFCPLEDQEFKVTLVQDIPVCISIDLKPLQCDFFDEIYDATVCLLQAINGRYNSVGKGQIIELEFGGRSCRVEVGQLLVKKDSNIAQASSVDLHECVCQCNLDASNYVSKHNPMQLYRLKDMEDDQKQLQIAREEKQVGYQTKEEQEEEMEKQIQKQRQKTEFQKMTEKMQQVRENLRKFLHTVEDGQYLYFRMRLQNTACTQITVFSAGQSDCAVFASWKDRFPKINRFYYSNILYEKGIKADPNAPIRVYVPSLKLVRTEQKDWDEKESDYAELMYVSVLGVGRQCQFRIEADEITEEDYIIKLRQLVETHVSCSVSKNDDDEEDDGEVEEYDDDDDEYEYEEEEGQSSELIKQEAKPTQLPTAIETAKPQTGTTATKAQPTSTHQRCANCNQNILSKDLKKHEFTCKLRIAVCPICHFLILKSQLPKHNLLIHQEIICECGDKISSVRNVPYHLSQPCQANEEICHVCKFVVKQQDLARHRFQCYEKIYSCNVCCARIKGGDMQRHFQVEHPKEIL
ncbi:MAG: hypothetical protein EZS28_005904 [Streblomastix strix]|uniref:Uncharacterized protein n=1 Tax=Streblomastix strix TaxID=222440 RepID=A0A5J4WVP3_9EUKA|nr:MAG: hypothetical protein EZS28_005904 [Streblomastix strix]